MPRLTEVEMGMQVRIALIEGGQGCTSRLNRFGLYPGDLVRILRHAPFNGPLLLEVRGMEIALGRDIASKILVERSACDSR